MKHSEHISFRIMAVAALCLTTSAFSEKVLIYDETRGIIFVEPEEEAALKKQSVEKPQKEAPQKPLPAEPVVTETRRTITKTTEVPAFETVDNEDIHKGRKKDPPDVYFKSALEYFKNQDWPNALRNFTHAVELDPQPKYYLWIGKTYRQMNIIDSLFAVMNDILARFPESTVADDALFEIAFYYQRTDNYDSATILYGQLAEQYPFGSSFSNGEEFREISRKQRQTMRAEMMSTLKLLGYDTDKDPTEVYLTYQMDRGLRATGRADRQTVRAIKAQYKESQNSDAKTANALEKIKKLELWAIIFGAATILNIGILLLVRLKIAQRRRQLALLSTTLSELDVTKI